MEGEDMTEPTRRGFVGLIAGVATAVVTEFKVRADIHEFDSDPHEFDSDQDEIYRDEEFHGDHPEPMPPPPEGWPKSAQLNILDAGRCADLDRLQVCAIAVRRIVMEADPMPMCQPYGPPRKIKARRVLTSKAVKIHADPVAWSLGDYPEPQNIEGFLLYDSADWRGLVFVRYQTTVGPEINTAIVWNRDGIIMVEP
jgi:hypothetical protein